MFSGSPPGSARSGLKSLLRRDFREALIGLRPFLAEILPQEG
jgi:hypothetical protein